MVKKQLIMEKALELFAKQGFEATSVQQITDHCGISKGAFYLSFKSKDELIFALIDQFMMQITSDIDHVVNDAKNNQNLLFDFYYTVFETFKNRSDFAKILIKEQTQSVNAELLTKIRHYDQIIEKTILVMVERLYGNDAKTIKYDLVYCIKGFMSMYTNLFLFYNVPLDLNLLSRSLVDKTDLLAKNMTLPFISKEMIQMLELPSHEDATKDQILEMIEQKIEELEDPIEIESLTLLKQQLLNPTLSNAIVIGLLENLRHNPHCKWVSYLLRGYFKFD